MLFAAIVIVIASCIKRDEYPDRPLIEYKDFIKINNGLGYDDKGILILSFTDGDGDIGLKQSDTFPPYHPGSQYYYNFFITYYEKQHGEYEEVILPISNNARIPILSSTMSGKALKGEIEMELYINNYTSPFDTIRFRAYITDRALHHSDTITTPDIIIDKQ